MDVAVQGLRVLRAVAEEGTLAAAARAMGYTQLAISREVAALENAIDVHLVYRSRSGVILTEAGQTMLRHAVVILDQIDLARQELHPSRPRRHPVRLGIVVSVGGALVPPALTELRRDPLGIEVTTREGSAPALVRAVRAGTLDLALLSSRPPYRSPNQQAPSLVVEVLGEVELLVAVCSAGRFAGRSEVHVGEIQHEPWIASPASAGEPLFGVWPGLPGRPKIQHVARDWLTKLQLVAANCGISTVPPGLAAALPNGVHLVSVLDGPAEVRQITVAHLPGQRTPPVARIIKALRRAMT